MARTQRKKGTRPSRQALGREQESNHMVTQSDVALEGVITAFIAVLAFVVVPQLLYNYVAPMQGWI